VGERREQQVSIIDLNGLRMGDAMDSTVQEFLKKIIKIDSDNYPEMSGKMFVVNAPFLFKSVWGIISSFMDARTRSKISMYGSNYKEALLECIREEDLPDFLGGKCACPGGCCQTSPGPWQEYTPSPRRRGVPKLGTSTEDPAKTEKMLTLAQEALEKAEKEEERELNSIGREGPLMIKGHTMGFWHTRWAQLKNGDLSWYAKQRHCEEQRKVRHCLSVSRLVQIAVEKDQTDGLYFHLTYYDGITYSFYSQDVKLGHRWLIDIRATIYCVQEERKREEAALEGEGRNGIEGIRAPAGGLTSLPGSADPSGGLTGVSQSALTERPAVHNAFLALLSLATVISFVACLLSASRQGYIIIPGLDEESWRHAVGRAMGSPSEL